MASVLQEPSGEERNWAELPWDVLSVIFEKLGALEVLLTAQAVCRPWWRLSLEPRVWQRIDLVSGVSDPCGEYDLEKMARAAVDRSLGQLVEFYIKDIGNDDLLQYIAERTTLLRCLGLVSCLVSDEGLIELAKKFPMLEVLEVSSCTFSKETFESVGHSCPQLKCFRLNSEKIYKYLHVVGDEAAIAIAENMPELCQLQLFGNKLTNAGLQAILDGCPKLESLDLRQCYNVNLQGTLLKRCERIKDLRLPCDSTTDCLHVADITAYESWSEIDTSDDWTFD